MSSVGKERRRPIFIDGLNVGYQYTKGTQESQSCSYKGLRLACYKLENQGHLVFVIFPSEYESRHDMQEYSQRENLPLFEVGVSGDFETSFKKPVCSTSWYKHILLYLASIFDGVVLSNAGWSQTYELMPSDLQHVVRCQTWDCFGFFSQEFTIMPDPNRTLHYEKDVVYERTQIKDKIVEIQSNGSSRRLQQLNVLNTPESRNRQEADLQRIYGDDPAWFFPAIEPAPTDNPGMSVADSRPPHRNRRPPQRPPRPLHTTSAPVREVHREPLQNSSDEEAPTSTARVPPCYRIPLQDSSDEEGPVTTAQAPLVLSPLPYTPPAQQAPDESASSPFTIIAPRERLMEMFPDDCLLIDAYLSHANPNQSHQDLMQGFVQLKLDA